MRFGLSFTAAIVLCLAGFDVPAETKVVTEGITADEATANFEFKTVPRPSKNDAASTGRFILADGRRDPNGGQVDQLNDGQVPSEEDEPARNFFFAAGTDGGRILVDLGRPIDIKQICTYSWHAGTRGPQVYRLYASNGKTGDFNQQPKKGFDPEQCGWTLLARVDNRPKTGESGGQYGVVISDTSGLIGSNQFLLFDVFRTEDQDAFGNTFFSEIDVIDVHGPAPESVASRSVGSERLVVEADSGKYSISLDTTETPDLTPWMREELAPVVREWYPRIARLLASDGFEAPRRVSIQMDADMRGVAGTSGSRIRCAATWYRQNLKSEAKGSVVHELVHVVQRYGRRDGSNPHPAPNPGWLVEGIADYIRWFHFEPASGGAEITKANLSRARHDGSYRITANFLDWVSKRHGQDIVPKLNAAMRAGTYHADLWKELTGRNLQELNDNWKQDLERKLAEDNVGDRS